MAQLRANRSDSNVSHEDFVRLSASELQDDIARVSRLNQTMSEYNEDGLCDPGNDVGERMCRSLDMLNTEEGADENPANHNFNSLDSSHSQRSPHFTPSDGRSPSTLHKDHMNYISASISSPMMTPLQLYSASTATGQHHGQEENGECSQESRTEDDQGEKIKLKLMTAWNNMKHGWTVKTRTNFRYDSAIMLLGKCYCNAKSERDEQRKQQSSGGAILLTSFDRFTKDFSSRIWCTYRKEFAKLYGSQITSDVGWGCMLRSGQMMLAQAFSQHFHGRDWIMCTSPHKRNELILHRQIIRLFADCADPESPFSLHQLVRIGIDHGKRPGDWYGPASVAYVLRDALLQAPANHPLLNQLCIYVAPDCTVYKQDVIDLCTRPSHLAAPNSTKYFSHSGIFTTSQHGPLPRHNSNINAAAEHLTMHIDFDNGTPITQSEQRNRQAAAAAAAAAADDDHHVGIDADGQGKTGHHWKAAVILVPVRLGGENLNPIYMQCVQALLAHDLCLGIIGGRPKHSLYFIGWQEDKLIHLDPHFCQDTVDMRFRDFPLDSYHCQSPRKMSLNKMDPSCTICFYCPSQACFERLEVDIKKFAMPAKEKGMYPLFVFHDGHATDIEQGHSDQPPRERYLRVRHVDQKGRVKGSSSKGKDDFVFL